MICLSPALEFFCELPRDGPINAVFVPFDGFSRQRHGADYAQSQHLDSAYIGLSRLRHEPREGDNPSLSSRTADSIAEHTPDALGYGNILQRYCIYAVVNILCDFVKITFFRK